MAEEERPTEFPLYHAGFIPGIPGEHGAGVVTVDWDTRSVMSVRPFLADEDSPPVEEGEQEPPKLPVEQAVAPPLPPMPQPSSNGG